MMKESLPPPKALLSNLGDQVINLSSTVVVADYEFHRDKVLDIVSSLSLTPPIILLATQCFPRPFHDPSLLVQSHRMIH
jgi:hypothetical protein